jgi:hypothetical protein
LHSPETQTLVEPFVHALWLERFGFLTERFVIQYGVADSHENPVNVHDASEFIAIPSELLAFEVIIDCEADLHMPGVQEYPVSSQTGLVL